MKISILYAAGLSSTPAHKVQKDYIYEHAGRLRDMMLFPQD